MWQHLCRVESGFSVGFCCVVHLLCLHNTLITTNFDVLKYIKKIFKILTQYIFNAQQRIAPRKPVKNLNHITKLTSTLNSRHSIEKF